MVLKLNRLKFDFLHIVSLALLFFAGLNFDNKYYYFCFASIVIFLFVRKKLIVDLNFFLLLVFSVSWLIFSPDLRNVSLTTIIKPFIYPAIYLLGRNFWGLNRKDDNEALPTVQVLVALSSGPFVHYLINYLTNLDSSSRNTTDIWTGMVLSATAQAALACMMMAVCVTSLFMPVKMRTKLLSVLVLIVIFLYNLVLSGRTLFVLLLLIVLVCSLYYFIEKRTVSGRLKLVIVIVTAILIMNYIYANDLFGVRTHIEDSNIFLRFINKSSEEILSSGRTTLKMMHLKLFTKSIFGGSKIRYSGVGYAHDLVLDAYDEAGIFALISLVLVLIRSIVALLKCIRNKNLDFSLRMLTVSLFVAFFVEFSVEPIIQGSPWLFALFCCVYGLVEYTNTSQNNIIALKKD